MPLTNYKEVRPWAKSIQKKVVLKEMPPWYADSSPGEFTNDISISQQEIDSISQWVDARAPQGSRADLPPISVDAVSSSMEVFSPFLAVSAEFLCAFSISQELGYERVAVC